MSSEPEQHPKVEIGHVLTMDVVEYSTLLITEQTQVMGELTSVVKNTQRFQRGEMLWTGTASKIFVLYGTVGSYPYPVPTPGGGASPFRYSVYDDTYSP